MLVVDDDGAVRKAISKILQQAGFTVVTAEHGQDALAKLPKRDFQAVVSDMNMPVMDGMQLFEALCQSRPELARRVVFLTGSGGEPSARQFLARNKCAVLDKPVEMEELVDAVRGVIASTPYRHSTESPTGVADVGRAMTIGFSLAEAERTRKSSVGGVKRPTVERRAKPRATLEDAATAIVQSIIRDPIQTGEALLRDLDAGGDPEVLLGLLDAAEAMLELRGVERGSTVAVLRTRVERRIQ